MERREKESKGGMKEKLEREHQWKGRKKEKEVKGEKDKRKEGVRGGK